MSTQPIVAPSKTDDFMPLHGIDHVEFYVGNALQAASYWVRSLGFTEVAYAGLETGVRDRASHVLRFLVERKHLDPKRISATAYADTQPLLPKSDPRAVRKNRRVEIVIGAQLDEDARRALVAVADGAPTIGPASDKKPPTRSSGG